MPETWAPVPDGSDFPLENLPFGVARIGGGAPRVVVRIGDHVVDLPVAGVTVSLTGQPTLNALMASGQGGDVRAEVAELLVGRARDDVLHPIEDCEMLLPFEVADYVDSYSSIHHATNLGKILRPDSEPLMPNWRHIPVAYHGRAGSVVVSGTPVQRPAGMLAGDPPSSGPSRSLDIELEVGAVIGRGGARIAPDEADDHVFGFVLLNDWSARDIQAYEYQPLGPNLGKSFATTISPWVVTLDALRPFLVESPPQDPPPDPYLRAARPWGLALELEVWLNGTQISRDRLRRHVLDVRSAARAHDRQRRDRAHRRPHRIGHGLGAEPGRARQPHRDHLARTRSPLPPRRIDPQLPRRR